MNRSRFAASVGMYSALSVALRLAKNFLVGPVQFVNFPFMIALIASSSGAAVGLTTGVLGYFLSDLFLGFGPWTLVNSLLCGLVGGLWSRVRTEDPSKIFILCLLSEFTFDVTNSTILYMMLGLKPVEAFVVGVIGLFMPVMGGSLIAPGPITEISTSLGVALLLPRARRMRWFH